MVLDRVRSRFFIHALAAFAGLAALAFPHDAHAQWRRLVGTTPCGASLREFLSIPAAETCERLEVDLRVRGTAEDSDEHRIFRMEARYGTRQATREGRWRMAADEPDRPWSSAFDLDSKLRFADFRDFVHPVGADGKLLVGDMQASYTLTKNPIRFPEDRFELFPIATGPEVAGVYEGTTPCSIARTIGFDFHGDPCQYLRWRLTLFWDPATRKPTRYRLEGSLYRRQPLEGDYEVVNTAGNAFIRLAPAAGKEGLVLTVTDGGVLFFNGAADLGDGGRPHAYTLNRVSK